ncbi:MAG: serine hydrolase [Candidatus Omnitrophica bacterium]|nr:serine hydrolase [Candidatus Omnitrophota bacterium]
MLKKILLILFAAAVVWLGVRFFFQRNEPIVKPKARPTRKELEKRKFLWNQLERDVLEEKRLFGHDAGIVIEDLATGWRIMIDADRLIPAASMVKLPILASCGKAAAERRLSFSENIMLRQKDKVSGSGVLKTLPPNQPLTIDQLITLMIAQSDNTATNMLIDRLGFDYLNRSFKSLGLKHTNISRKMMDMKSRKRGIENYTTAEDLAFLLKEIYYGKLVSRDYSKKCLSILLAQKMKDRIPKKLPPETPVAHKTGLENFVCHDAGLVFTPKGNFLICVLTKHNLRTAKPAKRFIQEVSLKAYNFYQSL